MTITKKSLSFLLTLVMMFGVLCGFSTPASAASIDGRYPKQSITGYILAANNKTAIAYSSRSCSGSSRIGYIYANDNCTIQEIYSDGIVKVKCPWTGYKNGRVVYSKLSYFFQNTSSVSVETAIAKTKCYNKSDLKTSPGYVYVKDKCYIVGTSGSYYQALVPWNGGGYKLCWVSKSAFSHTHNYTSGYEAAHPHKAYMKCSCGAYYYTGKTVKPANCTTCSPASYSVSNNVVTLKGVRLYEYPIGSKVPSSSYYFNVNGKSSYMGAKQCYGYACYVETKLYGSCPHTNRSHFPNIAGSVNIKPTASQFKSLITKAGVGSHIRTGSGHSLIVASINSNSLTIIDANANWDCKVSLRTYTWSRFLSSYPSIAFIEHYV
ncbi:MAG: hypothetical protein K2N06_03175 [Oscillospiraceae bacterium]|nr:hypothetical protein [Oscillospiraceae bacterium]